FLLPRLKDLVQIPLFHRLATSSKEYDTFVRTMPQMVPFSSVLGSCYCRRTLLGLDICPNSCHSEWHKLSTCFPRLDLPSWFSHRFEDDMLDSESVWSQGMLATVPNDVP